ncbi:MAG: hypothetical protein ABIR84_11830, partial [Candidatus Nitrotoga sp.]
FVRLSGRELQPMCGCFTALPGLSAINLCSGQWSDNFRYCFYFVVDLHFLKIRDRSRFFVEINKPGIAGLSLCGIKANGTFCFICSGCLK